MLPQDFLPKKRKGQNFLVDKNIINKILKTTSISGKEIVLEIGPGKGALTRGLANRAKKVVAVELDKKLYDYLNISLIDLQNMNLIHNDILRFDISEFLSEKEIKQKITIIGNIPYSITTPILEYIFKNIRFLKVAYLMVQKEFALRLTARPDTKEYSSISCFSQFHSYPTLLFCVSKNCFRPRPKVDSCFIKLEPKRFDFWKSELKPNSKELLFKVIRVAFNQRRKNILNSLSTIIDKAELSKILSNLGIDYNKRAENLAIRDFIRISNLCFDYFNSRHIILGN